MSMPHRTLPTKTSSARLARAIVIQAAARGDVPPDIAEVAVLLASEAVANAVTHGRSGVDFGVGLGGGMLRVEVGDDNSRHPRVRADNPDALSGRGMHLIDSLAESWGVRDDPIGKTVWFQLSY